MKEAMFYKKLNFNKVLCEICPNNCVINEDEFGKCRARKNIQGKLIAWTYGKPCSISVDPIEKKPLYHFYPGSRVYSFSTIGCNLKCRFCQNFEISQDYLENVMYRKMKPEEIINDAIRRKCNIIAYTYTEPTVFYEFVLDCAKLAHKRGLKNVIVSNGYINLEPLKELYKYIDAANIDLKAFDDRFYRENCGARLKPVLDSIKKIHKMNVWIEITNLIIPNENDNIKEIEKMCRWIKKIDKNIPLHFSRFFPMHEMAGKEITNSKVLKKAYDTAKKTGLNYVYLGNLQTESNTYCPKCGKILIRREAKEVRKKCDCSYALDGVF